MVSKIAFAAAAFAVATAASAKLPDPAPEQAAAAQLAAAKAAHAAKADGYALCRSQEKVAVAYLKSQAAKVHSTGGKAYAPVATPPCVAPEPFVAPSAPAPAKKS